jgi:hypothetical protein
MATVAMDMPVLPSDVFGWIISQLDPIAQIKFVGIPFYLSFLNYATNCRKGQGLILTGLFFTTMFCTSTSGFFFFFFFFFFVLFIVPGPKESAKRGGKSC